MTWGCSLQGRQAPGAEMRLNLGVFALFCYKYKTYTMKPGSAKNQQYQNPVKATLKGIRDLFRERERVGELRPDDRLDGKTVMVTGASSGLGLATSIALAKRGARVIMACRSGIPSKGEEVKRKSGSDAVEMVYVDLSDMVSIQRLVDGLGKMKVRLDVLVCNAAIVPKKSRKTPQGLEQMFVVNYFAKFVLLDRLLKHKLIRQGNGALPRIIFVSSESHRNPKAFDLKGFGEYRVFGIGKAMEKYGYYKMLLTTLAVELSRRLNPNKQPEYSVFALCPGPVNSNIAREAPAVFQPLLTLIFSLFFKSPQKACEPVVYLAASPDMEGRAFEYLFMMGRKDADEKAADPAHGRELWHKSTRLLEQVGHCTK